MRLILIAVGVVVCSAAARGLLPDPKLTPGALNAAVTQANIGRTICKPGWTDTIRPPKSYTNRLKRLQMQERGLRGLPQSYEEDHLISLELGGDPRDPRNLWPQPWPQAKQKDVVETRLKRAVCAGEMSLRKAQRILATDWTEGLR